VIAQMLITMTAVRRQASQACPSPPQRGDEDPQTPTWWGCGLLAGTDGDGRAPGAGGRSAVSAARPPKVFVS
jgi:hypothetical protein